MASNLDTPINQKNQSARQNRRVPIAYILALFLFAWTSGCNNTATAQGNRQIPPITPAAADANTSAPSSISIPAASKNVPIPPVEPSASTKEADEAIRQRLNELLHQPNSVLTKMQTFQKDEDKPKLRAPLSATIGSDIILIVSQATPFNPQFKALDVKIENRSDSTLVMDGDRAYVSALDAHATQIPCLAQRDLDAVGRPPTTMKEKIAKDTADTIGAALTVGAIPTAKGVITEHGPIRKRYEWDEQRREREESRLGQRLLYPGDKTEGLIYFRATDSLNKKTLTIPVKSFYDGTEQTALRQTLNVE
ncbi:MAG TPA: hypothetical protein V6C86_25570 [Oculatellaceae cyanobacterium]